MSDDLVLVSMRVLECDPASVPAGATIHKCGRCSFDVWVSPASLQAVVAQHALIRCVRCAMVAMEAEKARGEPIEILPPTPEQRREAEGHLRWR